MLGGKDIGHEHYETERTLDAKTKKGEVLTPDEETARKDAIAEQIKLYAEA